MLCWTDKPAAPNAFTSIVNDLDLTVTHISNNMQWLPWVLNSAPVKDSLQSLPVRKRDSLNTIEQITLDEPATGDYSITVSGYNIATVAQKFFIACQWDTANSFHWTYPVNNDNLLPGKQQVCRWNSNFTGTGLLEYKYAGTSNWVLLSDAVTIASQFFKWIMPDTNAVAQLRFAVNGLQYVSDSFTISAPLQTGVGYNCLDGFLLYWNKIPATSYQVYKLGSPYLEAFRNTTDTTIVINKNTGNGSWFSAAPVLSFGKQGIRSLAFNYTLQGVDCYIKSFTADLVNGTAHLGLTIGTTYRIAGITIEKADRSGAYQVLQRFTTAFQLQYNFTDDKLGKGINLYRIRIELVTGVIIYSGAEAVYFLAGNNYLIYPNPVTRTQPVNILSSALTNPVFQIFNTCGQKLMEKKLYNLTEQIALDQFASGLYFYTIIENGKITANGKIILQ